MDPAEAVSRVVVGVRDELERRAAGLPPDRRYDPLIAALVDYAEQIVEWDRACRRSIEERAAS